MATVTICSDFGAQKNKVWHCFPIYLPWSDATGCHDLRFWMLSFKPTFSFSTFTFIKRLLSSSSLSAIRVVSSASLRLLTFLPAILIPACTFIVMFGRNQYNVVKQLSSNLKVVKVLVNQSCLTLCDPMDYIACQTPLSMEFSRQDIGVCSHCLLQVISPTQGSNLGLLHCWHMLYHLSHQGRPILKMVLEKNIIVCTSEYNFKMNISFLCWRIY